MGEFEADSGSYSSEVEDAWTQNIDRKQLLLAVDKLPGEEKRLVYLRYAIDMSFKVIDLHPENEANCM